VEEERATRVHTPMPGSRNMRRGLGAVATALILCGLLIGVTGGAAATPTPTLAQAKATLAKMESRVERIGQQYDQVQQQLTATERQLVVVDRQLALENVAFGKERGQIADIAVASYENGNVNASVTMLTEGDAQKILDESSILAEISSVDQDQILQLVDAARQLTATQELARRTRIGIEELRATMAKRLAAVKRVASQEQQLVDELSPAERLQVGPGAPPVTTAKYKGPTKTQAEKAVAFAYAQLGCPYVYGGTGPCADGFDCSGLTQAAWASAGVSIERTSYEQWDSLPHVAEADMEPGDIMVFNGAGHVGIYVGKGMLIDAPHTGANVELVAFSGWYQETFDGAVRP
jgi:peptidoglycan DL-endopeptidase CwlO